MSMDTPTKSKRGFASMDPEKQRAIAAMGGKAAPAASRSFSKNKALAKRAGEKGGRSVEGSKRSFARDPALASEAGRKGGLKAARNLRRKISDAKV